MHDKFDQFSPFDTHIYLKTSGSDFHNCYFNLLLIGDFIRFWFIQQGFYLVTIPTNWKFIGSGGEWEGEMEGGEEVGRSEGWSGEE